MRIQRGKGPCTVSQSDGASPSQKVNSDYQVPLCVCQRRSTSSVVRRMRLLLAVGLTYSLQWLCTPLSKVPQFQGPLLITSWHLAREDLEYLIAFYSHRPLCVCMPDRYHYQCTEGESSRECGVASWLHSPNYSPNGKWIKSGDIYAKIDRVNLFLSVWTQAQHVPAGQPM